MESQGEELSTLKDDKILNKKIDEMTEKNKDVVNKRHTKNGMQYKTPPKTGN